MLATDYIISLYSNTYICKIYNVVQNLQHELWQRALIFWNHSLNFGQKNGVVMVYMNGLIAEFMVATQIENQA